MLQQLAGGPSFIFVIDEHFVNQVNTVWRYVRDLMTKAFVRLHFEIYFHMGGMLLEELEDFITRGSDDTVNFVDLITFVITGKERTER